MPVDETKLPLVLPTSVARVTATGLPTKELLDWEQYSRDWYKKTVFDLDRRTTTVEDTITDPDTGLTATAKGVDDLSVAVGLDTSGPFAVATKITTLETSVGDNSAAITNEATARTNADSALSGQITTVSAQAGTATANGAVALIATAGYPAAGKVSYSWYITATGHPGGVLSYAGMTALAEAGGGSSIVFQTNALKLYDPIDTSNPKTVFAYSGGKFLFTGDVAIDGSLVVSGTITAGKIGLSAVGTDKIAPNSVTNVGYGQSSIAGNAASCAVAANNGDSILATVTYSQATEVMDVPGTTATRNVTCDGGQTTSIAIPMIMTHADVASDNTVAHQYFLRAPTTRQLLFTASGNGSHVISAAGLANCDVFISALVLSR